jgi:hypothetical protein
LDTCVIKKLPKVNNHPTGENSPNLVTLIRPLIRVAVNLLLPESRLSPEMIRFRLSWRHSCKKPSIVRIFVRTCMTTTKVEKKGNFERGTRLPDGLFSNQKS